MDKVRLSKAILDMKFMKKSKERVEKEDEDAESKAMYATEMSEAMRIGEKYTFVESSSTACKDLIDGRMSFQGMNPAIEAMMAEEMQKRQQTAASQPKEKEADVTEVEMAENLSSITNNLARKFQTKKARNQNAKKNMKFKKPKELE